jgi:VanZ family protein
VKTLSELMTVLEGRQGKFLLYFLMTAIMLLALIPPPELPQAPGSDKFQHAIAFCFLTLFLHLSHPGLSRLKGAAVMLGYGCLMEFLQSLTAYRSPEFADLLADSVGIASAQLLRQMFFSYRKTRSSLPPTPPM